MELRWLLAACSFTALCRRQVTGSPCESYFLFLLCARNHVSSLLATQSRPHLGEAARTNATWSASFTRQLRYALEAPRLSP